MSDGQIVALIESSDGAMKGVFSYVIFGVLHMGPISA